jgi:hypothetical protein
MIQKRFLATGIIVLTPLVYFGLLFTTYGLGPFEDDLIQYFPNIAWLGQQLRAGVFPFWNGLVYGGYPQVSDPQSGLLYPLNWLSAILPMRVTYPLLLIAHYWIAGWGMYRLGREWGLARGASTFGAVAWMFCGFMLGHRTHYTMLAAAGWMSMIFYLWTRIPQTKRPQTFWVLAILCQTMQILAGHVQVAMMTGLAVFLYLLFTLPNRRIRYLTAFAVGYGFTLGLAAVQLLPVWQLYAESVRSANSYRFITENSFFPLAWTLMIAPASLGLRVPNFLYSYEYFGPWNHCELNCFTTLVGLTLAAFAIRNVTRNANRRRIVIFLIFLAVLAIFLALGRYNPAFKFLYQIPIFRPFRCPARYLLWFNFAIAALAMIGVQSLYNLQLRAGFRKFAVRFVPAILLLFVGFVAALAVLVRTSAVARYLPESLAHIPQAIAIAIHPTNPALAIPVLVGLVIIFLSLTFSRRLARGLLVVLLIEIGSFAPFYDFHFDRIGQVNLYPPVARTLDELAPRKDGFIWPLSKDPYAQPLATLQPFTNMLVDRASITGYGPLLNRYHRRIFNWELWPTTGNYLGILSRPDLLRRYDIRYVIAESEIADQIDALRSFSGNGDEQAYFESLTAETEIVRPGRPWRHKSSLAAGMYKLRFQVRRLSSDQLRMFISVEGLTDSLWAGQRLTLCTWDVDKDWRMVEWTFFVPENGGRNIEILLTNDYGVCEIKEGVLNRTACSLAHLKPLPKDRLSGVSLYENTDYLGQAYFARSVHMIDHPSRFADRRMKTAEGVLFGELPDVTWLAATRVVKVPAELGVGRVTSFEEQTNAVEIRVSVEDKPAVLVIPGGYNNQWRAQVDGFDGPVLCADGISRALIVPPGEHTIFMNFSPVAFQAGSAIAAFTALLMIFIFTAGLSGKSERK